jgi:hypothetical protein
VPPGLLRRRGVIVVQHERDLVSVCIVKPNFAAESLEGFQKQYLPALRIAGVRQHVKQGGRHFSKGTERHGIEGNTQHRRHARPDRHEEIV